MEQLILHQLDIARKLYGRIQNTISNRNKISIDLIDCADSLSKIKISTTYRKKDVRLTKEETLAIEEICQMEKSVKEIMGALLF
jgi:hypothetical protein